jgi:hypothetical protein
MSNMLEDHCPVCGAEKFRHRCSGHAVVVYHKPECDFCAQNGDAVPADYDAKTVFGPWAYMCEDHWKANAAPELGTGIGQRLVHREEGEEN